jgi:ribosomal protein S18 acetylase RimI-like enzyme
VSTPAITIDPLTEADFAIVRDLGERIWRQHYASMISHAQIDFMLAGRYTDDNLRRYVGAADRAMWIVRDGGLPIGYCACSLATPPDSADAKLEQVYLLADKRGGGVGARMIAHVEAHLRARGATRVYLTVNKQNTGSIAVYQRLGYTIREAAVFDIGGGYVMDDYVMEKALDRRSP